MQGISQVFIKTFEIAKIGTFMGSLFSKEKIYELKIYKGVMSNDIEEL